MLATVSRVLAFGASVRVELTGLDDKLYEVELTRTQRETLQLRSGQQVILRPVQVKVFDKKAG
ncbi:MAG: TOBE-like domain-containing protein [Fluviicoccus sp.]|nr:TOBE-like domain-containing protein [Fluviicoccus sp.]MDO8328882.1 TOBE-like domain-containing protein [Fluviicoccus sp.]